MGSSVDLREALAGQVIEPAHVFRGETITQPAYTAAMYCDFTANTPVFHAGAAACGLDLAPPEVERGRRMVATTYWVNDQLYRDGPDREDRAKAVIAMAQAAVSNHSASGLWVPSDGRPDMRPSPQLSTSLRLLDVATNVARGYSHDERRRMLFRFRTLGQCALDGAAATDASTYADVLRQRADAISCGIAVAYMNGREPRSVREPWQAAMRTLLRAAVLKDGASDLAEDHERGLTGVRPTRVNQAVLLASGVREVARLGEFASNHRSGLQAARQLRTAERGLVAMVRTVWRTRHDGLMQGKAPALPATVPAS